MEYDKNYDFALSLLIEQYGDLFSSFQQEAKDGLIEQKRQILNMNWEQDNLRKAEERSKKAKQMAKQMKSKMQIERLCQSSMGAYKRYKSVSISMEESCEYKHVDGAKIQDANVYTIFYMGQKYSKFDEKFYELYKEESKEYDDYYELDDMEFLTRCIVRGATYSFDFAKKLNNSDLALSERICSAISGRFIMSNYLEEELTNPFCIRYPDIPTKVTCISISKKFPVHVVILSILMNWEDIFNSLDIKYYDRIACLINREFECFNDYSNSLRNYIPLYKGYFYEKSLKDYCEYDYNDLDAVEKWNTGLMGWDNLSEAAFEGNYILDNVKTYKFKQIKDYNKKDYAS